ncbi:MAG: fabH [Chlamydiales bacterium]|jgi:3-oxoacyl-[acyl-carrier-protein] synthase-3|nr:fabH [Chlamydiales bacterium]
MTNQTSENGNNAPLARIIGTGTYLPENILSNFDLETLVETSDEWIFTRTGIKERRIGGPDEFASTMGAIAAQRAIENAKIMPEEIDLVIVATMTPDYLTPSTGALIQKELKLTNVAAFDMQAACTGYVYGLSTAKAFIESKQAKCVLLVATEKVSTFIDYKDRTTCILFGDGAAAAIITAKGAGLAIRHNCLGADGEQADLLRIDGGGSRFPATEHSIKDRLHYLKMDGKELFKHAVRRMENAAKDCLDYLKMEEKDISWLIPHQANIRIIDAIAKRFSIPNEKIYTTIHKYGNTSASSVAIALDEFLKENSVITGENLLLIAFGAGLTWGASVLTKIDS